MKSADIIIRSAEKSDARALVNIYAPYILNTAVTFETEVPTPEAFGERISHTLRRYPYLVAEHNGQIIGYAYAVALKGRPALDCSVEASIYLRQDAHRNGTGRQLYNTLFEELQKRGVTNVYASIAYTEQEDEFLTHASIKFHERMGFSLCGAFHRCAVKFGRHYDLVWMEKVINAAS